MVGLASIEISVSGLSSYCLFLFIIWPAEQRGSSHNVVSYAAWRLVRQNPSAPEEDIPLGCEDCISTCGLRVLGCLCYDVPEKNVDPKNAIKAVTPHVCLFGTAGAHSPVGRRWRAQRFVVRIAVQVPEPSSRGRKFTSKVPTP